MGLVDIVQTTLKTLGSRIQVVTWRSCSQWQIRSGTTERVGGEVRLKGRVVTQTPQALPIKSKFCIQ